MKDRTYCLFGKHQYEVYKEVEMKNTRGETEAIAIVSRCKYCGKVVHHIVPTIKNY